MPDPDPPSPLPHESLELRELLARHTHETWMNGRLADGWKLGLARDDAAKTHPCLIPYEDLPEGEKDYDRATSQETLKLIQSLGWQLLPPSRAASSTGITTDAATLVHLAMAGEELEPIQATPETFRQAARLLRAANAWIAATHLLAEATRRDPSDVELLSLKGLALSRTNRIADGLEVMEHLYQHGYRHQESLGIFASLYKQSALASRDEPQQKRLFSLATQRYLEAYQQSPSEHYWAGINAATLLSIADKPDDARPIAEKVREVCTAHLAAASDPESRYWLTATLAEAALHLGEDDRAAELYKSAASLAAGRYGWIVTTRRNLRLLLASRFQADDSLRQWLPIPPVICFSGHALDRPGGAAGRFPPELEEPVAAAIRDKLKRLGISHGFSSAACGGDLLFAESTLAAPAQLDLVLPYGKCQFAQSSLDYAGPSWRTRFDSLTSRSDVNLTCVSESKLMTGSASYEYAIQVLHGLAVLRSRELETDLICLALLDTKSPTDDRFGVRANVKRWQQAGRHIDVIDLAAIRHRAGLPLVIPRPPTSPEIVSEGEIAAMIFADVVGFSSLGEDETPNFAQHFFRTVSELITRHQNSPLVKNTWGDGLFFVFRSLHQAGQFALDLRDQVLHTKWKQLGFSRDLSIRIGLHAGPVLPVQNPITERVDYLGTHVSRAARLEPVTPKGSVYATARFVAVASAQNIDDLSFCYAGMIKLPKGAGKEPVYVVQRQY